MATAAKKSPATDHPSAWIAQEAGDQLQGEVVEIIRAWSDKRNDFYPILKVKTADGLVLDWHAFHTVSYNQIDEKRPIPGEHVVITYRGEGKDNTKGNPAKVYHLTITNRDPRKEAEDVYARMFGAPPQPRASNDPPAPATDTADDIPWH